MYPRRTFHAALLAFACFSLAATSKVDVSLPQNDEQQQLDDLHQQGYRDEELPSDVQPSDFVVMEPTSGGGPEAGQTDLAGVNETAVSLEAALTPAELAQVAASDSELVQLPIADERSSSVDTQAAVTEPVDSQAESAQPQNPPAQPPTENSVSGQVEQAVAELNRVSSQVLSAASSPTTQKQSQPQTNAGKRLQLTSVSQGTSVRSDAASSSADDITSTRPSVAAGVPDVVTFGLFAKNFFGASLRDNTFSVDSILLLKWNDPRALAKLPAGMEEVTLSGKQALSSIWMPEVVVTNRGIRKYEIISSSVTIKNTGEVTKVERAGVMCYNIYELAEYPFDIQKLEIKVASSKYMLDEVVMKPEEDRAASGANKEMLKSFPYVFDGWKVYAFDDIDGALQKSRGVLEMRLKRTFDKYAENHLMPVMLLVFISWGVFWFPFQNPFITPRLALSIIVLLSFTTIMLKADAALPDGIPPTWHDVFNAQVQAIMTCTIVLNIFSECCKHQHNVESLGVELNHEAKVVLPCLSLVVIGIALSAGAFKWLTIGQAVVINKTIIILVMAVYVGHAFSRLQVAKAEKARADAVKIPGV